MFNADTTVFSPYLEVEEDDRHDDRYKKVHKAGCGHLIDPEPVADMSTVTTVGELVNALESYSVAETGDSMEYVDSMLAPCARRSLGLR